MADLNAKSGGKVVVGCKLPHGLVIQLERLDEQKGVDGAVARRYIPFGDKIALNGANSSNVIGGYGLTPNIDADLFSEWLKRNADYEPVRQGPIFAQPNSGSARDQAKDQASVKNGFEGVNPKRPAPGIEPRKDD